MVDKELKLERKVIGSGQGKFNHHFKFARPHVGSDRKQRLVGKHMRLTSSFRNPYVVKDSPGIAAQVD